MKKKSKLSKRITWRVIWIMTFFNVFIIGAIVFSSLIVSEIQSTALAKNIIDGIDGKLVTMQRAVEIASKNNVAEIEEHLSSPEEVFEAMEHELRLNDRYIGCAAAFKPDFFKSEGRWFEAYVKYTDSTRMERRQIGSAEHDYFHQEWYEKAIGLKQGQGYFSSPYLDKDGSQCIVITYSTPIHDRQGHQVGVYGIDLNLSWLLKLISDEEESYVRRLIGSNDTLDAGDDVNDDETPFFVQILSHDGERIAGSGSFDDKSLKTIMETDNIGFKIMTINDSTYGISSQRISNTGWTLVVAQHVQLVYIWGFVLGIIILFFMGIGAIVIFFFMRRSIRRATKPLAFLSESAQEVAHGNFDTELPTFKHQDEIAQLRDSFDTMQQSLKGYVEELKESTAAKASIESELNVAYNIQMSMLPKTFPAFPSRKDIELYGSLTPAKGVGGDLYDFFIRDEKLFFCIGDVSGKGVPASLVMAVTRTLFRNIAAHTAEPSHIMETVNMNISEGDDTNMFVTLFVGVLDLATGRLRYCNAGHDAPYMISQLATAIPCDPNLPVGVLSDWKYSEQETTMESGSTIFLYTDGLTEAENAGQELFGVQRVEGIVNTFTGSPDQLIETMTTAVHQFVGDTEQSDDLTMLAIKYIKPNNHIQ
jgi:sigma-B regulation protein RsbU (phosphoserine phosphatase)